MSEQMQEKVEKAIEESEILEHFGTLHLDALSQKECQDRVNITQTPKLSYETIDRSYSGFSTFLKNQEQLCSYYPDQPQQQLVQLSKITSPEIAKTLMSFSGSENCATKALEWLHL